MSRFSRVKSVGCAEVSDGSLATSGRSSCVMRHSIYGCSRRRCSFWSKIKKSKLLAFGLEPEFLLGCLSSRRSVVRLLMVLEFEKPLD